MQLIFKSHLRAWLLLACKIAQVSFDDIIKLNILQSKSGLFCFDANFTQSTCVNIMSSIANK